MRAIARNSFHSWRRLPILGGVIVARDVAIAIGLALAVLIVVTVVRVARGRPPQATRSRGMPKTYGRSMRSWQAGVLRDIRRQGRRGR